VARRLSRWYNAEIIVADPQLYPYTFYATFQDEQLDEVLKLLALTTPIMYEEIKRELSSDGLYAKRKIILKVNPKKIKEFK
jgi:ferric-dicitrate binding protein FerR (iron transport regulator)